MKSPFHLSPRSFIETVLLLLLLLALLFALTLVACTPGKKERVVGLVADSAMVVTAHPLASKVGVDILRQGGNAIDAAIATQLALAVVYPSAGNIGGGGFMVLRMKDGRLDALDYREKAPGHASTDMYLDEVGGVVSGLSQKGHLAHGVPGTVAGLVAVGTHRPNAQARDERRTARRRRCLFVEGRRQGRPGADGDRRVQARRAGKDQAGLHQAFPVQQHRRVHAAARRR